MNIFLIFNLCAFVFQYIYILYFAVVGDGDHGGNFFCVGVGVGWLEFVIGIIICD